MAVDLNQPHQMKLPDWRAAIGLDVEMNAIGGALHSNFMHPVVLLHGPKGVGKRHLANWMAASFLCQKSRACGVCPTCKEVIAGLHPDILVIDGREMTSIKSSNLESLQNYVNILSSGGLRIAVITDCDRMTKEAANKILKTLEEPPEQVRIIMTTSKPKSLLPTVLGRCLKWRVVAPKPSIVVDWFRHQLKAYEIDQNLDECGMKSTSSDEVLLQWIKRFGNSPGELKNHLESGSARTAAIAAKVATLLNARNPQDVLSQSEAIVKALGGQLSEVLSHIEWELNRDYKENLKQNMLQKRDNNYEKVQRRRQIISQIRPLVVLDKIALNAQLALESIGLVSFQR